MAYFPMFVDLRGRICIVAGGGNVALRKVQTLLRFEAEIFVYSLAVSPEIAALLPEDHLFSGQSVSEERLQKAALVVAATGSRKENHRISTLCHRHDVPVDVIDAPEECSFLFPAVVLQGDISIGINTAGKSPAVSARVRRDIEQAIPDYYGDILDSMAAFREQIKEHIAEESVRRYVLREAARKSFEEGHFPGEEEVALLIQEAKRHGT